MPLLLAFPSSIGISTAVVCSCARDFVCYGWKKWNKRRTGEARYLQANRSLFNQSNNQSIKQSIKQLVNQSIKQLIYQSIIQSIKQSIDKTINQSIKQPLFIDTLSCSFLSFIHSFIYSFIPYISKAPLQVHYYSEALPTQHGYCVEVSH